MLIKMLETRRGCEDGFNVRQYHKGEVCDVRDNLACEWLHRKYAEKYVVGSMAESARDIVGDVVNKQSTGW